MDDNLNKHRFKMLTKLVRRGASNNRVQRAIRAYERTNDVQVEEQCEETDDLATVSTTSKEGPAI